MSNWKKETMQDLAARIKSKGFRVFLAKDGQGEYGFYTDQDGSRVCSFQFDFASITYTGCYTGINGARGIGTGWRIAENIGLTQLNLERTLYAGAPRWAVGSNEYKYTTLEMHLARYQASSKYKEI